VCDREISKAAEHFDETVALVEHVDAVAQVLDPRAVRFVATALVDHAAAPDGFFLHDSRLGRTWRRGNEAATKPSGGTRATASMQSPNGCGE